MAHLESVNVGARDPVSGSGIGKRSVEGPVLVHPLGLEGDHIGNLKHHGGPDQAVYAYAGEDLDVWAGELGRALPPGAFGENLTTRGLDVSGARLGERWSVGGVVLEVCDVRTPCPTFQKHLGERAWARRFIERGAPGAYLRVVQEGQVRTGDGIRVEERPEHGLTVALAFRALTTERHLLPNLLAEPRLAEKLRRKAVRAQQRDAERTGHVTGG